MFVQEKQGSNVPALGLYAHVPFCSTSCDFCAFYQERPSKKGIESFFRGLESEILRFPGDRPFSTVFVGGGTPGILSADQLERLCGLIRSAGLEKGCEWTIELAPTEVTAEKLRILAENGVNRASIGAQTFDPGMMEALGRGHKVEKTYEAYSLLRESAAFRVNLDLIFGAPGQTLAMWEEDLHKAVELDPEHLSTYCLTFEEDTAMYLRLAEGKVRLEPEREAAFYEKAWALLPARGYPQYEVSNFSKPGMPCLHNLNTWGMNEWIGYGPSASSQYGGFRRKNSASLDLWEKGMRPGAQPAYDEWTPIGFRDLAMDAIIFGLRMNEGISLVDLARRFGVGEGELSEIRRFFAELEDAGMLKSEGGASRLTTEGRMRCDAVAVEMPELQPVRTEKGLPQAG